MFWSRIPLPQHQSRDLCRPQGQSPQPSLPGPDPRRLQEWQAAVPGSNAGWRATEAWPLPFWGKGLFRGPSLLGSQPTGSHGPAFLLTGAGKGREGPGAGGAVIGQVRRSVPSLSCINLPCDLGKSPNQVVFSSRKEELLKLKEKAELYFQSHWEAGEVPGTVEFQNILPCLQSSSSGHLEAGLGPWNGGWGCHHCLLIPTEPKSRPAEGWKLPLPQPHFLSTAFGGHFISGIFLMQSSL